jgi:hypothetical protein
MMDDRIAEIRHHYIRHEILVRYRTPTVRFRTVLSLCLLLKPNASKACSIGITVGKHMYSGLFIKENGWYHRAAEKLANPAFSVVKARA